MLKNHPLTLVLWPFWLSLLLFRNMITNKENNRLIKASVSFVGLNCLNTHIIQCFTSLCQLNSCWFFVSDGWWKFSLTPFMKRQSVVETVCNTITTILWYFTQPTPTHRVNSPLADKLSMFNKLLVIRLTRQPIQFWRHCHLFVVRMLPLNTSLNKSF